MQRSSELERWRSAGDWFESSAGRLFVREQGEGETLLLIHGFPTSSWDWHAVCETLATKFHVVMIDMLGYGYSDKPANYVYSTESQVELIDEVLKSRSISELHVMTYSYGVSVAQEMLRKQQAGQFSCSIKSLCCMNGGLFPDSNHPRLTQRLILGRLGWLFVRLLSKGSLKKNLKAVFGPDTQPSELFIDQYWELINYNQGRSKIPLLIQYLHERRAYMHDWEQALVKAACPIQLIIGDQDEISGVDVANEFRLKISADNVNILAGIGHYPQLEAPEKVCDLYFEFVANNCF